MHDNEVQIKKLNNSDVLLFQKLVLLFSDVFEMSNGSAASESYLKGILSNTAFVALVIMYKHEIAGGLTAYELPMYCGEYSELYIYDIAIKPEFQRKGFGTHLLYALKKHCKENRIKEFFVEAHEEDKHAISFYHSAGGNAEKVVHFNFEI